MYDFEREELESEWNARYDYIAELRAEHYESPQSLAYEAECYAEEAAAEEAEWTAAFGPIVRLAHPFMADDEIPF